MILLSTSDFVDGKYDLPAASSTIASTTSEVQAYIDQHEKNYIYKLLGVTLGDSIIAYIAGGSTGNTYFDKIIDPFAEDANWYPCGYIKQSLGLKTYLQACIYYEYTKDTLSESLAGTIDQNAELASKAGASQTMRKAEREFNALLGTIEAIQSVCSGDSVNYPGYNGSRMAVKGHQFFI